MAAEFTPRPWQPPMMSHILDIERSALFCPMGSGKTSATLTALDALYMSGEDYPTLILAPKRVALDTWPSEAPKWQHLRHLDIAPIIGTDAERRRALRADVPIKTINYDNLVWLYEQYGDKWPFRTVVADELTRLKSFRLRQGGKRAAVMGKVAHRHIKRFWGLTGTPASNGLKDLWGQVWMLDSGARLGRTYDAFRSRWFQQDFNGWGMKALPHAQEQIQDAIRDICLTIDLKDYVDIAEPIVNNIYVDLPLKAMAIYRDMEKQMFAEIEGHGVEALNAAARTQKCLQLANGAAYVDESRNWKEVHDVKLEALDSIVEEANGVPVLTAYNFVSDRERIKREFKDAVLDLADAEGMKAAKRGKGRIWLGHPKSIGHGVDGLQEHSNILAFFGHDWNLEERLQIIERIGPTRQMQAGLDRPVFIHNIIARGTVDEMVIDRVNSKREVQDILLEAMKRRRE